MGIEIGVKSGRYVGNGSEQTIEVQADWRQLQIVSADRRYVMYFFKDNGGNTQGQAAIGSGGTFKQLEILEGGISEHDLGFSVGNHVSVNESGTEYFWSVS